MNTTFYIEKINSAISNYVLLLGFLFFLTGILFFNSVSAYHTYFYLFLIAPALFFVLTNRNHFIPLLTSRAFQILLLLLSYTMFSLLWNDPDIEDFKYIKRLLIILLFVLAIIIMNKDSPNKIISILLISASIYACAAYYSFYMDFIVLNKGTDNRIIGIGNLSNPLLSSHIYGTFTAFLMAYFFALKRSWKKDVGLIFLFVSLLCFVLLTKSRTPLLGLSSALLLMLWMHRSKYLLYFFLTLCCLSIIYFSINFEQLTDRGLSYRPEIWLNNIEFIKNNPILGYGFGTAGLGTYIKEFETVFTEPHNIHIGLTYSLGMIGLIIWFTLLVYLLSIYLKNKTSLIAQIGIVLLAYGISAGMTEGGSFFSRPKEVWFLTWLPIALLLAAEYKSENNNNQKL